MSRTASGLAILLTAFVAVSAAPARAQTTVTLDAPESESIDTVIRGGAYATTNFDDGPLATRPHAQADFERRTLLKFNTETGIPRGAVIRSAVLTLTVKGGDAETRRIGAYRLPDSFDAPKTTWQQRKSGIYWATPGGDFAAKYAEGTVAGTVGARLTLDLTRLVQEVVNGAHGVSRWTRLALMDLGAPSLAAYREYHPSEAADARLRPTLVVTWGGSTPLPSDDDDDDAETTGGGALPSGWSKRDIGSTGASGSASVSGTSFVVQGAGLDVWGTSDQFHFAYKTLTGDGSIVAQVATLENVDAWTKAGVMMRETLTSGSRHAFMLVSPGKGLAFQRRPSTGGLSVHTSGGSGAAPRWVRLTRQGSSFVAAKSSDGVSWTTVGSQTMNVASTIFVGLAVGSHATGDLATASFDGVKVTAGSTDGGTPPAAQPPPSGSSTLRLLQWNVAHGGRRTDGVYDPVNTVNWILEMDPDVASLNEVDNLTQAKTIVSLLESKTKVDWDYQYDERGNLLVSKLPIEDKDICVVNSSAGRKSAFVTVLAPNGRKISIYSAHLSLTLSERLAEVPALQACASDKVQSRILAGDYNMQPGSTEYQKAMALHTDAWKVAKSLGTAVNYDGNCDGCTRKSRIDYVFTSSGATALVQKSAQIYDTRNASGVAASDHKPMVVVYTVK